MHRQVQLPTYAVGMTCRYTAYRESVERVLRNLEIPKTPGLPGFSPCVDLGDCKRVSVLTRPAAGVFEVEDAFQIDSRDDRQIQVYIPLSLSDPPSPLLEAAFIPSDYNFTESRNLFSLLTSLTISMKKDIVYEKLPMLTLQNKFI